MIGFAEPKRFIVSPKAGVAAVNMRAGPGGEFATVSQVPAGEVVIGTGQSTVSDGTIWIAVTRSDGSKGYIAARLLSEAPAGTPTPTCDSSAPWADYTVCSNGDVKTLDQEMRRAVALLRKALNESDRTAFDDDQSRWLGNRQNCASSLDSTGCLTTMYRDRISEINEWPKSEMASPVPTPEAEVEEPAEPSPPTIAVPARLRNSDNLITNDDYPAQALRNREQGVVTARFQVDDTGRVSGCTVIVSSGSRLLDDQTCSLITRRFRYDPARSASGVPLFSTATKTVRWTLP